MLEIRQDTPADQIAPLDDELGCLQSRAAVGLILRSHDTGRCGQRLKLFYEEDHEIAGQSLRRYSDDQAALSATMEFLPPNTVLIHGRSQGGM